MEVTLSRFAATALLAVSLLAVGTGCRKAPPVAAAAPKPQAERPAPPPEPAPTRAAAPAPAPAPAPEPAVSSPAPRPSLSLSERLLQDLADVYFSYDQSILGPESQRMVQSNAEALRRILADFPGAEIVLEGHADERGSAEYNLGLGDRRAVNVKTHLTQLGMPSDKFRVVSLGKERPQCTDASEGCWQKNRRVRFAPAQ